MNENLKKLIEEASKNEELKKKLNALTDKDTVVEKTIEIAKEYGITLKAEDFKPEVGENISLDELNKVSGGADLPLCVGASGGKTCMCVIIGAATGCGCVFIGTN